MPILRAKVFSLTRPQDPEAVAASSSDQDDPVCEGGAVCISLEGGALWLRGPVAGILTRG